jgi:hypothetical protein
MKEKQKMKTIKLTMVALVVITILAASSAMAVNLTYRDVLDEAAFAGSLGGSGYAVPWYSAINDNSMAAGDSTWAGNYCFWPSMYLNGIDWGGMAQYSWTTPKSITEVSFYRVTPGWGWYDPQMVMVDYQNLDDTWTRVSGGPTGNWIPVTWANTSRWGDPTHRVFTVAVNAPAAKAVKLYIGYAGSWAAVEEVEVMGRDTVPEPGSILALATGLLGLGGFVIRKRQS